MRLIRLKDATFGPLLWILLLAVTGWQQASAAPGDVVNLEPGPDLPYRLQEAFITVKPGTTINLPAGSYHFDDELVLNTSHVTLKGQGMDKTILSFKNQPSGAQGVLVVADAFTAEDLAIEDTAGDGLRIEGADGIVIRRVRVEWTNGPDETNGAYGLYPVLSQNVLVEDSIVRGASDAGIYVGQSADVVVRRNLAEYNVAGIEIENTQRADVYENTATHNTGGILVFDLPGLSQAGSHSRVFNNTVVDNNTSNFAPAGNIVGNVPSGTGVMVMATDDVEIYNNKVIGNKTVGATVVSYVAIALLNDLPLPPGYDPFPERVTIRDNKISRPRFPYYDGTDFNTLNNILHLTSFKPVSDISVDGITAAGPEFASLCITNNKTKLGFPSLFGNLQLMNTDTWLYKFFGLPGGPVLTDLGPYQCQNVSLPPVELGDFPPVPDDDGDEYTPEEVEALCGADTDGVNFDAHVVNCPELQSYHLFANQADPTRDANNGFHYDLTSPLFSDYANKYRFIFLPEGTPAEYQGAGLLGFPVGTIIAKTFAMPLVAEQPGSPETVVETRLLIRREAGWVGLPYIWDRQTGVAHLALGGGSETFEITTPEGEVMTSSYRVPNANQCKSCHANGGLLLPIGPKARLMNKVYAFADEMGLPDGGNQLDLMAQLQMLHSAPDSAEIPRTPTWNDPGDGTLQARAKAYLDINCAHCHSAGGRAYATGLLLNEEQPVNSTYGVCKSPVAAGRGSGGYSFDIAPGNPDESILVYRMESNDPAIRMPELGRSIHHQGGIDVVREWISTLTEVCQPPGVQLQ
ncbi:hypothetical protein BTA51_08380 [Hahella sp. CCB-MM4]|uniref:parallel beta-helix domain-containing protein n=1 Tax=Hahella sp. (strain CCB-MM4) TaxID=1926491 RepID=UPI000B9B2551|nr:parallel beta-helix domain-containing protein [Hahella sp. CCB-MM4]OZG73814.1 hypothetical protein BTA51_08380 [Hahella sp. CCB-MM4]